MRTALALILMAGLGLTGCGGSSKVVVVNTSRIYQESEAGKAGLAYIEQVEKDVKSKAETAQRVAESMPNNSAMPMSLQQFFIICQDAMNTAQQQAVDSVQELITKSIAKYREQNNATIIIQNDAVVSMDPVVDATDAIIAEMNKSSIAFAPVSIDDFIPPQAPVRVPPPAATSKVQKPAR